MATIGRWWQRGPVALVTTGAAVFATLLLHRALRNLRRRFLHKGSAISSATNRLGWRSSHPDAVNPNDEPIELCDFLVPIPHDTAAHLERALGRQRFDEWRSALSRAPAVTFIRVQYLPDEDDAMEGIVRTAKGASQAPSDATALTTKDIGGDSSSNSNSNGNSKEDNADERRIAKAANELENRLKMSWMTHLAETGRTAREPFVYQHPLLRDVLIVQSVPSLHAPNTLPKLGNSNDQLKHATRNRKVIIVDRLCGEAVLKGSDVFARGVLVASSDLQDGNVVDVWCDLGDFRSAATSSGQIAVIAAEGTSSEQEVGSQRKSVEEVKQGTSDGHSSNSNSSNSNPRKPRNRARRRAANRLLGEEGKKRTQKVVNREVRAATEAQARLALASGGRNAARDCTNPTPSSSSSSSSSSLPSSDSLVLHGCPLHRYRGRRLRLGWGVAKMERTAIIQATRGLAVKIMGRCGGSGESNSSANTREVARPLPHPVVGWDAPPLNGLLTRRLYASNLASCLVAHVLAPRPGECVIDLCAAPGGKSTHVASLMKACGRLFSLDHSKKKVQQLAELFRSLGYDTPGMPFRQASMASITFPGDAGCFATAVHLDSARAVAMPSKSTSTSTDATATTAPSPPPKKKEALTEGNGRGTAEKTPAVSNNQRKKLLRQEKQRLEKEAKQQHKHPGGPTSIGSSKADPAMMYRSRKKLRGQDAGGKSKKPQKSSSNGTNQPCLALRGTISGFPPESFDRVLLDPPCSALGLRPRFAVDATVATDLAEMVQAQRRLLWSAVMLLRPAIPNAEGALTSGDDGERDAVMRGDRGGILVYSTCTVNPDENERQVRYVLDTFPCLRLARIELDVGDCGLALDETESEKNGQMTSVLSEEERRCVVRFNARAPPPPSLTFREGDGDGEIREGECHQFQYRDDAVGFFVAKFVKVKSSFP